MNKISAIIIAKDEELMIADCLDSVSFCDEIVLIDNGSTDNTCEIAKRMGAKVYKYVTKNFSTMRNFGLEKANEDWILYIDADERITSELRQKIKRIIEINDHDLSAYKINRKNFYFGQYEWPYIEKLERLFKRNKLKKWYGELHESPIINGQIGEIDGYLLHYTHRNLSLMLKKTIEWSKIEAELRFRTNHPKMAWWRFPRVMMTAFLNSYVKQKGWKIGVVGLIESTYQSFSAFITYARLWELQKNIKDEN